MRYSQFDEKMFVALYQESGLFDDEQFTFRHLAEKYGIDTRTSWIRQIAEEWNSEGYAVVEMDMGYPQDWQARITGAGLRWVEEKFGNKDGVEVILDTQDFSTKTDPVPASDRRVSITHNQFTEVEPKIANLVEHLDRDNVLPDDSTFRQRIIGQIRAGRELLRSGEVKLYIVHITLFAALNELIARYKDTVIGGLAIALLDHLISPSLGLK